MLSLPCRKTLKRKLLSGAIFGVASGAFFLCIFGLLDDDGISRSDLDFLAFIVLPATIVAFLVTPGKDKHIENCSWGKALLAGAGITALAYFASYTAMSLPTLSLPTGFMDMLLSLYSAFAIALLGAFIMLPVALPFGMLGGLLYWRLARRTLSTN